MELKKPNHLPASAEINVVNSSERKNSQDQGSQFGYRHKRRDHEGQGGGIDGS